MQRWAVFGLILASLLLVGTVSGAHAASSLFPKVPVQTTSTYYDESYGFSFDVPKGWTENIPIEPILVSFGKKGIQYPVTIGVMYQYLGSFEDQYGDLLDLDKDLLMSDFTSGLAGSIGPNIKITSKKLDVFSDGIKITVGMTMPVQEYGKKTIVKIQVVAYVMPNGDSYYLMYLADAKDYKQNLPAFKKAVQTFYVYPIIEEEP